MLLYGSSVPVQYCTGYTVRVLYRRRRAPCSRIAARTAAPGAAPGRRGGSREGRCSLTTSTQRERTTACWHSSVDTRGCCATDSAYYTILPYRFQWIRPTHGFQILSLLASVKFYWTGTYHSSDSVLRTVRSPAHSFRQFGFGRLTAAVGRYRKLKGGSEDQLTSRWPQHSNLWRLA